MSDSAGVHTAPLLVASDVDGTLINSQERITPRLKQVIGRLTRAGTVLTLATGRPPRWIHPVLEQLPTRPICICANGAILYDSRTDTILTAHTLKPAALTQIADIATQALADHGGCGFAVERAGISAFDNTAHLFATGPTYDHAWDSVEHGQEPHEQLLGQPAIKLLIRSTQLTSQQMHHLLAPHIPTELAHTTYSLPDGLIEIAAPGITKATGVAEVADLIGAAQHEVMCFGDMPNDIEMLTWAGHGVAMGNAEDTVKAAADETTTTCDDDGVARVLERYFP